MSQQRNVVVHLHLFKNAGTSVERGLESFFGEGWASFDKASPGGRIDQHELIDFLAKRPQLNAVSSHQLRVPLENTKAFHFLPLVFLRNPLDRIRSAYDFERNQGAVSPSSRAAASLDMASWIDFHRSRASTQCRNFQTFALSAHRAPTGAPLMRVPAQEHLASALEFLDQLPVVGVVEAFDQSWSKISDWVRDFHPEFRPPSVHSNSTADQTELVEARVERLRRELGEEKFARLCSENEADMELQAWATAKLGY